MTVYRRGSKGPEVRRIQEKLRSEGHYLGPLDGIYGGGTEGAVRDFQEAAGLKVDGRVGPNSWAALFGEREGEDGEPPEPEIASRSLGHRVLALTGSFETGSPVPDCFSGLTGDFDGQGISFGALQWNFGQGSLPPLLREMRRRDEDRFRRVFGDRFSEIETVLASSHGEQLEWARSIQDPRRFRISEPWAGCFRTLGRIPAFRRVQVDAAETLFDRAVSLCRSFDLRSERAGALMFDITVQNGGIPDVVGARIRREFGEVRAEGWKAVEERRLEIVANRRAEASIPRWIEDVRSRKLAIARGRGEVHGGHYDLAGDYGLRLVKAEAVRGGTTEDE